MEFYVLLSSPQMVIPLQQPKSLSGILTLLILVGYLQLFQKKALLLIYQNVVIESMTNPVNLSPLQEEFLALHERLCHLPFSVMFRLVKAGILPKKFKKLNNKAPPCVSCMLGQAHKKPWRFKKTKHGAASTLKAETIDQPGDTIGVDQLISA